VSSINPQHRIIEVQSEHLRQILLLNQAAIPHVNEVDEEFFHQQLEASLYFRAILLEGSVRAFLLGMSETASYQSLNFLWFQERYAKFIYVDRIVVDRQFHRGGLGRALYTDFEGLAKERRCPMACEVNIRPPNPISTKFHESFGFCEVGQQEAEGGAKRVSLMVKDMSDTVL